MAHFLSKKTLKTNEIVGGSTGLVVMLMTHVRKVMGLNPSAEYWKDIFSLTCKNCIVCLKRTKINEKEAKVGPFY